MTTTPIASDLLVEKQATINQQVGYLLSSYPVHSSLGGALSPSGTCGAASLRSPFSGEGALQGNRLISFYGKCGSEDMYTRLISNMQVVETQSGDGSRYPKRKHRDGTLSIHDTPCFDVA
jgi:hypothetical protein